MNASQESMSVWRWLHQSKETLWLQTEESAGGLSVVTFPRTVWLRLVLLSPRQCILHWNWSDQTAPLLLANSSVLHCHLLNLYCRRIQERIQLRTENQRHLWAAQGCIICLFMIILILGPFVWWIVDFASILAETFPDGNGQDLIPF